MFDFDVVVVGGGASGCFAAMQAARTGARTLLVEKNGMLGGTTTVAGVALPGLFHAWGRQIIAGLGWKTVTHAVELAGGSLPDFADFRQPHFRLQVAVEPAIYAACLDADLVEAGADVLLHTMVASISPADDGWNMQLCAKEGLIPCSTKRVIDCTGDADIVGQAGLDRVANSDTQPGTIMVRLSGYELDALDFELIEERYQQACERGDLEISDLARSHDPVRSFLRHRGENSIHVVNVAGSTSAQRTSAEFAARRTLLRIFNFLRQLPGLEQLSIDYCAIECGIRETYTIVGREFISVGDYTSGRVWDDALCYSFYPVDVHQPDGDGIDIRPLQEGIVATIPRGAMIPERSDFIAVAGRCIAGDQEANSAYRVQATCMATGQAAGAMTALSALNGTGISKVPLKDVRAELRRNHAIVPDPTEPQLSVRQEPIGSSR